MTETISLDVRLQAFVRRDTARRWIASCPLIGVTTQGATEADARECLQEAVELWFESCIERGVLEQALREANFRPSSAKPNEHARVRRRRSQVVGEPFIVHLTIPGYEAAPLRGATA
jgi:predicted RNase H-like HicB family nuclease